MGKRDVRLTLLTEDDAFLYEREEILWWWKCMRDIYGAVEKMIYKVSWCVGGWGARCFNG